MRRLLPGRIVAQRQMRRSTPRPFRRRSDRARPSSCPPPSPAAHEPRSTERPIHDRLQPRAAVPLHRALDEQPCRRAPQLERADIVVEARLDDDVPAQDRPLRTGRGRQHPADEASPALRGHRMDEPLAPPQGMAERGADDLVDAAPDPGLLTEADASERGVVDVPRQEDDRCRRPSPRSDLRTCSDNAGSLKLPAVGSDTLAGSTPVEPP